MRIVLIIGIIMAFTSSYSQENDLRMGKYYYDQKDYKHAFHYFVKSQIHGDTEAPNYLGICYEHGYGVDVNISKAIEWYEIGIKKGDVYAMVNLGCLYSKGIDGINDEKKAFSLFKESAEKGCNYGQRMLGFAYYKGLGPPKDGDLAIYWLTKAKDNGDELASKSLPHIKLVVESEKEHQSKQVSNGKTPHVVTLMMTKRNQVYYVPCKINGLMADFIFDTGAGMVSLSASFIEKLKKQGLISKGDFVGQTKTRLADGRLQTSSVVNIKDVEIGGLHLKNVNATIKKQQDAPLLLGLSAIEKLGSVTISSNQLIIVPH